MELILPLVICLVLIYPIRHSSLLGKTRTERVLGIIFALVASAFINFLFFANLLNSLGFEVRETLIEDIVFKTILAIQIILVYMLGVFITQQIKRLIAKH